MKGALCYRKYSKSKQIRKKPPSQQPVKQKRPTSQVGKLKKPLKTGSVPGCSLNYKSNAPVPRPALSLYRSCMISAQYWKSGRYPPSVSWPYMMYNIHDFYCLFTHTRLDDLEVHNRLLTADILECHSVPIVWISPLQKVGLSFHCWGSWFQVYRTHLQVKAKKANCGPTSSAIGIENNALTSVVVSHLAATSSTAALIQV